MFLFKLQSAGFFICRGIKIYAKRGDVRAKIKDTIVIFAGEAKIWTQTRTRRHSYVQSIGHLTPIPTHQVDELSFTKDLN